MNFFEAKKYILGRLKKLPPHLLYHGYHHTLDVYEMALEIAREENIHSEEDLILLKTAALYHDIGFISVYKGHEEVSCLIAAESLIEFNYSARQIDVICGLIMATKIPSDPKTHLEEILADADLDYLGRSDFYPIADSLYKELINIKAIKSEEEWNRLQVNFLTQHKFFTKTSIMKRKVEKEKRLEELKRKLSNV